MTILTGIAQGSHRKEAVWKLLCRWYVEEEAVAVVPTLILHQFAISVHAKKKSATKKSKGSSLGLSLSRFFCI